MFLADAFLFLSALDDSTMMSNFSRLRVLGLCKGEEKKNFGGEMECFDEEMRSNGREKVELENGVLEREEEF